MQEKAGARLREYRLQAHSGRWGGEFTQPSIRLFLHVSRVYRTSALVKLASQEIPPQTWYRYQ